MTKYYISYIFKNWSDPGKIFKRGFLHLTDLTKSKLVLMWVKIGVFFQQNFFLHSFVFDNKDVFIRLKNSLEFIYLPKSGGFFGIEFGKTWESAELSLLRDTLPRKSIFLDVGASFGWYSMHLAKEKAIECIAFEPSTIAFNSLQINIRRNNLDRRVKMYKLGLGDKKTKAKLTNDLFLGNYVFNGKDENKLTHTETVKLTTLDDFVKENRILKIDAIKCDIEGGELFMLKGAEKTLKKHMPILLIEIQQEWTKRFGYDSKEIFSYLGLLGYDYLRIKENGKITKPINDIKKELSEGHNFMFYKKNIKLKTINKIFTQ